MGYSPQGCKESDTAERLGMHARMRCSPHSQIATLQLIEAKMLLRCCQVTKQEYTHSQVSQEAQPDA